MHLFPKITISRKMIHAWEIAAAVALMISLGAFIASMIFHFESHHIIEIIEILVCSVFLGEITINLIAADNKLAYLKKNWFYILTILPILGAFKVFRIGRFGALAAAGSTIAESEILGARLLALMPRLRFANEAAKMAYHLKRTDFKKVSKTMHTIYIDRFTEPHTKNIADGISDGMKHYFKKQNKNIVFTDKKWFAMHKIERSLGENIEASDYLTLLSSRKTDSDLTLVVTSRDILELGTKILGRSDEKSLIHSTFLLDNNHDFLHIEKFDYARGYIMGYNLAAKRDNPCYHASDCIHKILTKKTIDLMAFRFSLAGKIPCCELHS